MEMPEAKSARERAEALRRELIALSQEIQAKYLEIAALLCEMAAKELFRPLGYVSLEAFAEEELGFRERKCRQLVSIAHAFDRAQIERGEAAAIQPSKAAVIASILTPANRDEWIEKAKTLKAADLKRAVAKAQGRMISDEAPRPWTVLLFENQRAAVENAMELARLAAGTDVRGVMLECIAAEFVSGYSHLAADAPEVLR